MSSNAEHAPHILCVSWDRSLAETRELLLKQSGYEVTTALGERESFEKCSTKADLLLLGHSVPRNEKQKILEHFHKFNSSPALSLLSPGQSKLPDVEYAVEYMDPPELLSAIQRIIPYRRI
jgi:CheY-like chemotaxis protein